MIIEVHGCKFSIRSHGFDDKPGDLEAGIQDVETHLMHASPAAVRAIHKTAIEQELLGETEPIKPLRELEQRAFGVATRGWARPIDAYIWIEAVE